MNSLNQILNISPEEQTLSSEEFKVINEILSNLSDPPAMPNRDEIVRCGNDFLSSMYRIRYNKGDIFVKISPHSEVFAFDQELSDLNPAIPVIAPVLDSGKILGELHFTVCTTRPSELASSVFQQDLARISKYFAGMNLIAQEEYTISSLPSQSKMYSNIFDSYSFYYSLPDAIKGKLVKKYPVIKDDFLREFSERCQRIFNTELISSVPDVEYRPCLGPLRKNDIALCRRSHLPQVLLYPYLMSGNPLLNAACFPYYVDLSPQTFFRDYAEGDAKIEKILNRTVPFGWLVDFYLHFIDEIMRSTIDVPFFSTSSLRNSMKYQLYRGWISNKPELKEWTTIFDSIFLEKFL